MLQTKNYTTTATRILILTFVTYALWFSFVFFSDQLIHAASKPFWGDEIFGLEQSIRGSHYFKILVKGAYGQASPSPLDYILCKILADAQDFVHSFGLPQETYYRLWANLATTLTALAVMIGFLVQIIKNRNPIAVKILQAILLSFMPICLWYTYFVYHYAA